MKNNFYITTPIYYGNGLPHVGHFYSSTIANILFRYAKIHGKNARFTTGIDENSQKALIKAQELGMDIGTYLDSMAQKHKEIWDYFHLDYTDFIRTTSNRHHRLVQKVLQHCYDAGDIYQDYYEGKYCIGCEVYKKDDELIERDGKKVCADHLTEPQLLQEKNYFFKLSRYQNWLQGFYEANPDFVLPHFRFNEVKAFVERGLEDFSISRETNTFGIPLPFDKNQVTYVWFDALFNYYTSCVASRGGKKDNEDFIDESGVFWESDDVEKIHVVGKDIIRFHAIFWPAMLASYFDLGSRDDTGNVHYKTDDKKYLPTTIIAGGFFTVDGQKMSKSIGNVIEPVSYTQTYSQELLELYILSAFPIGNDGDYNREDAIKTYNAKLANNLGNLVNRVVVLALKLSEKSGVLDSKGNENGKSFEKYDTLYQDFNLKGVLDETFQFLDSLNKYADETQPWQMIKTDEEQTRQVLYTLAEGLRQVGLVLYPFFPKKMSEMFEKLGLSDYTDQLEAGNFQAICEKQEVFMITQKGEALFARIQE